ncbi:MAG TPA: hypothetical protein VG168_11750 [Bryobacteraceae bacterium]|nr:hypothetical protein [Bryobacteraceae bacterium]
MFQEIETRSNARFYFRPFWAYGFHLFIGFPLAMLAGVALEPISRPLYADGRVWSVLQPGAAIVAGFAGFGINLKKRNMVAAFVFILPLLLFWLSWYDAVHYWSPKWSNMSHDEYVMNSLFGPSCGDEECLGMIGTQTLLPGLLYSLGALVAVMVQGVRRR